MPALADMGRFSLDTSCMVAAVCSWHEHHRVALAEIERRLEDGEAMVVPAPALIEAYAVLTRLPPPHRLAPADAYELIAANFIEHAMVLAPSAAAYKALLRRLVANGTAGGRSYDAVISECARLAGPGVLLTFNRRHFDRAPAGVSVVEPA